MEDTNPRTDWKRELRLIGIMLAVAILCFALLNLPFFSIRLRYVLDRDSIVLPGAGQAEERPLVYPDLGPDRLQVPSLGIDAPIRQVRADSEVAFQRALRDGVVHYPGTAMPGEEGNAYLFGHSSDLPWAQGEYKQVFALLPEIAPGAIAFASDAEGQVFAYEIQETSVVSPDDLGVLEPPGDGAWLTLQTSYPLGTALRRFIARGRLLDEQEEQGEVDDEQAVDENAMPLDLESNDDHEGSQ